MDIPFSTTTDKSCKWANQTAHTHHEEHSLKVYIFRIFYFCKNCHFYNNDNISGIADGSTVNNMLVLTATGLITASLVSIVLGELYLFVLLGTSIIFTVYFYSIYYIILY